VYQPSRIYRYRPIISQFIPARLPSSRSPTRSVRSSRQP
jgi:hypothetical protein